MLSKHTQRELSTAQRLSTHGRPHLTDPRGEWPKGSLGWFVLFWFVTSLSSGVTLAAEKESLSAMPIHNEMHLKEKSKAKEGQGKESYKSTKRLPFLKISGRGEKKWDKPGLLSQHRNGVKSMSHFLPSVTAPCTTLTWVLCVPAFQGAHNPRGDRQTHHRRTPPVSFTPNMY